MNIDAGHIVALISVVGMLVERIWSAAKSQAAIDTRFALLEARQTASEGAVQGLPQALTRISVVENMVSDIRQDLRDIKDLLQHSKS